jgi:hypothetical protein
MKCPARCGSKFYDYKQFLVLLHAAVDSSCELSTVDIGAVGCQRDAEISGSSSLYRLFDGIDPNIPRDLALPGTISKVPFLLIGDEEYLLFPYLMTHYPGINSKRSPYNRPPRAQRGSSGIAVLIFDFGTRRGWVVSTTPRPLYPPGKTRYPLYRRLGWPQGRSGRVRKISPPLRFDPRTVKPVAQSLYRLSYPAHMEETQ